MTALPNTVALATIADGSLEVAVDPRNNFAAGQTAINGLIAALSGGSAGQLLSALSSTSVGYVNPPGFEIGYDQITANVTVSSATEATGTIVIACAAHTFDGSPVWVHFYCPRVIPGDLCFISLFEGATQICRLGEIAAAAAATVTAPVSLWFRMTPTAAAHTFTVSAIRSGVDTTIVAHAGGVATEGPAFVRFIKA